MRFVVMNKKYFYFLSILALAICITWSTTSGRLALYYILYSVYPSAFTEHEIVRDGSLEGIATGMSKKEALDIIMASYSSNVKVKETESSLNGSYRLVYLSQKNASLLLENLNVWDLYFDGKINNRLSLYFDDSGHVVKIERYKLTIEFP